MEIFTVPPIDSNIFTCRREVHSGPDRGGGLQRLRGGQKIRNLQLPVRARGRSYIITQFGVSNREILCFDNHSVITLCGGFMQLESWRHQHVNLQTWTAPVCISLNSLDWSCCVMPVLQSQYKPKPAIRLRLLQPEPGSSNFLSSDPDFSAVTSFCANTQPGNKSHSCNCFLFPNHPGRAYRVVQI